MMAKIFISQPMNNVPEEEIMETRKRLWDLALKYYKRNHKDDALAIELIDNYNKDNIPSNGNTRVWMLGDSIKLMYNASLVVFGKGWENARGCKIEMEICRLYDIPFETEDDLLYFEKEDNKEV